MITWNNDWSLEVCYVTEDGSSFTIPYMLYDSPYLLLWIKQWRAYKRRSEDIYAWFINKDVPDLPALNSRLLFILDKVREQDAVDLPKLKPNFDQIQFNEWHRIFEDRCHKVDLTTVTHYMELNALIHTIESISHKKPGKLPYRAIIGVLGLEEALPLLPEYQLFSHHSDTWGDITMSYATTGKNWSEVAGTNDLDAVENEGVTNKTLIRQEFVAHFYHDDNDNETHKHLSELKHIQYLYSWYTTLPDSLKKKVPIDNLNELYHRTLYLGHIDLKKLVGVQYDKYIESTIYRKQFQKDFNLNYFGKVTNIKHLSFINSIDSTLNFKVGNND